MSRDELLAAAADVARRAHAPYSRFRVGAAALDADGNVHLGCNLESATYTMTLHAEAVAMGAARVAGARCTEVAVVCLDQDGRSTNGWPCGLCRQLLVEVMGPEGVVHTADGTRTLAELLPEPFLLEPYEPDPT